MGSQTSFFSKRNNAKQLSRNFRHDKVYSCIESNKIRVKNDQSNFSKTRIPEGKKYKTVLLVKEIF